MSNKQASSYKYFIPVVLVVLSLITSVLFSYMFREDTPDSSGQIAQQTESQSQSQSQADAQAEPEDDTSTPDTANVTEDSAQASQPEVAAEPDSAPVPSEAESQPVPSSAIADFSVLVPTDNSLCDGQTPWREGDRRLSEATEQPACYGVRFQLAAEATVLLLQVSEDAAPRSMLADGCRPFGFSSARFQPGVVQQLPRGVDAQSGVFQVGSSPSQTSLFLIAAAQPPEPMSSLERGVANLCGQNASLTTAEVESKLDELRQLEGVVVSEVQGKL